MKHTIQHFLAPVEGLQLTPAGLPLPVPAHRARSCSTDSILLKKPTMAFSTSSIERRSRASHDSYRQILKTGHIRSQLTCSTAFGRPVRQRGFRITPIFNGLQPSKMTVHPCTIRSLSKNRVFQPAARVLFSTAAAEGAISDRARLCFA